MLWKRRIFPLDLLNGSAINSSLIALRSQGTAHWQDPQKRQTVTFRKAHAKAPKKQESGWSRAVS